MIQVTLPPADVAQYRHWEPIPALEEWAKAAWEWQATWAPHTLSKLMEATPRAMTVQQHLEAHFGDLNDRCWAMLDQISQHRMSLMPAGLTAQQTADAEREARQQAAGIVRAEWVEIPKEVPHPAYDPELDTEMFTVGDLEYTSREEIVEGVTWAVQSATSPDDLTPMEMTVRDLQHLLDHRLRRVERHLVFNDAHQWARATHKKLGHAPEKLLPLLTYPAPPY